MTYKVKMHFVSSLEGRVNTDPTHLEQLASEQSHLNQTVRWIAACANVPRVSGGFVCQYDIYMYPEGLPQGTPTSVIKPHITFNDWKNFAAAVTAEDSPIKNNTVLEGNTPAELLAKIEEFGKNTVAWLNQQCEMLTSSKIHCEIRGVLSGYPDAIRDLKSEAAARTYIEAEIEKAEANRLARISREGKALRALSIVAAKTGVPIDNVSKIEFRRRP